MSNGQHFLLPSIKVEQILENQIDAKRKQLWQLKGLYRTVYALAQIDENGIPDQSCDEGIASTDMFIASVWSCEVTRKIDISKALVPLFYLYVLHFYDLSVASFFFSSIAKF